MTQGQNVIAVVVTYNPTMDELRSLLGSLSPQVDDVVIVDNGSANHKDVEEEAREFGVHWLPLGMNRGIAAAQNQGIIWARNEGATYVLLSDQDSTLAPNMVEELLDCFEEPPLPGQPMRLSLLQPDDREAMAYFPSSAVDGPVAAVGPVPLDGRGGDVGNALVYSFTKWGAIRTRVPQRGEALAVPFVLASGCLISMSALDDVGPMNEALFIDHVDLAWCLRAVEKGYRILVSGNARIYHSLGDEVAQVPGRKKPVHVHSPIRNYYMMRNTLLLQSASFLPKRWKQRYLWWMTKYMGYYLLTPGRTTRVVPFSRALRDGLRGVGGQY